MADAKDPQAVDHLKIMLRERDVPFFTDEELQLQLDLAKGDLYTAAYQLCILKAEDCALSLSGLTLAESSAYWLRLAAAYRPSQTHVL